MKSLYSIYEGLLSGQDTILQHGNKLSDDMHLFHWKYGKSYRYKVYKNVIGGLGKVFRTHFIKKPAKIYTAWPADPIAINMGDKVHCHQHYNIDYLYAIILSTKLPKPIESYDLDYDIKDRFEAKKAIEENLRFYMTDDSRKFRTDRNKWPILTVEFSPTHSGITVKVYYHQNEIKYEASLLCDLEFIEKEYIEKRSK
jgi:hypothetical protein